MKRIRPLSPQKVLSLCLMGLAIGTGCDVLRPQNDPSQFYVLTAPDAASKPTSSNESKRWKLGLSAVDMPAYLATKSMVLRAGSNEIHFDAFHRWAEPLDKGISRVIKETLSISPNVESVIVDSHETDALDFQVSIRVLSCEGVLGERGTNLIRFAAMWETRALGTNTACSKRGSFNEADVAWDGRSYGALAEQLSKLIARASIAIAADLPAPTPIALDH